VKGGSPLVTENGGGSKLVRSEDFEGELEEHWQDAQGFKVLDKNGDEVGTVEDLYIYEDAQAVHLLKVEVDGNHFLIPVDAVTNVSEEGVEVEQAREAIVESPEHDSEDVPDPETSHAAYEHFGYPDQLALG
jgi:sporulation protein YlmC with PRC-barrel domain